MNDELTSKERASFYQLYLQAFQKVDDERTRAAFWARFNHAAVYRTTVGERVIAGL